MSELFLDIALIDIGRSGKPGAQGMAGEQFQALGLWKIGPNARIPHGLFDQPRHVFVGETIARNLAIIAADTLKQRAEVYPGIVQVLLERMHRAGLVAGAAANFNLAPAGFAVKCQDETLIRNLYPTRAVLGVIAPKIEADDFRAAQIRQRNRSAGWHGPVGRADQRIASRSCREYPRPGWLPSEGEGARVCV